MSDPFGIHNLPYGVVGEGCAVRLGERAFNLGAAEAGGLLDAGGTFEGQGNLNRFMAAGRPMWRWVREQLEPLLREPNVDVEALMVPLEDVRMPFEVADYVDFYSSQEHATNLGKLLRPGSEPLLPNWKHLPVGYHGRAGTVVVSGTPIPRPCGQRKAPDADAPTFGPSARLDIEAEVGFVIGPRSERGSLSTSDFAEHVFGVVLVNDWSARDIQAWEYQPLGPFLGKSFATSISPWVVPLEALAQARVPAPPQRPDVLPYLREEERFGYDISLEVRWNGTLVSRPPFAGLYWTPAQQLAQVARQRVEVTQVHVADAPPLGALDKNNLPAV